MKSMAYLMCAIQPEEHETLHEWQAIRQSTLTSLLGGVEKMLKERDSNHVVNFLKAVFLMLKGTGKWRQTHEWMTICYKMKSFEEKLVDLYPEKVKKDINQPEIKEDDDDPDWQDSDLTTGDQEMDE